MPVSTKRFSELRLMVSDLLQTGDWGRLFENCGTSDPELAKAVSGIFSIYDPAHVFKFVDYVLKLPLEIRRERRDSASVVCYILGRMGQHDTKKSLSALRTFLADDHMLRASVSASLGNLWILDRRTTERELLSSWILKGGDNDDLQEVSVSSSEYLLSQDPKQIAPFIGRVKALEDKRFRAARVAAGELASRYLEKKPGMRRQRKATRKRKSRKRGESSKRRKANRR